MHRLLTTLVAALIGSVVPAHAIAIPLTTLVMTNGTIVQGDKLFANFGVPGLLIGFGDITPDSYSGIDVQGVTIAGEHGLRFSGPFSATYTPGGSLAFVDYHIAFDVTPTEPDALLHDVRHSYVVTHKGNGSPFQTRNVRATTHVQSCPEVICSDPDDFAVIGPETTISTSPGVLLPSPTVLNETFVLPHDVSFLRITQDLSLIGSATPLETDPQAVAFPHIDVTFSQTVVPEPTTILLLGTGLASLGFHKRRRPR